jgi:hypothetical protein
LVGPAERIPDSEEKRKQPGFLFIKDSGIMRGSQMAHNIDLDRAEKACGLGMKPDACK